MTDERLVSVIIPIYDSEKYLAPCIESVLDQTFTNFELLLIDDGSSDRSAEICRYYQGKDKRIRLIQQENAGAGAARNRGLEEAQGAYIMFVDSDDYIDSALLERAYDTIKETDADLYICGLSVEVFEKEGIVSQKKYSAKGKRNYTITELLNEIEFFYPLIYISGPCCKLYRRGVIESEKIRFPLDLTISEDFFFNQKVLSLAKKVALSDEIYYHYRFENADSLSHTFYDDYYEMTTFVYDNMRELLQRFGCSNEARARFELTYFHALLYGITTCYSNHYSETVPEDRLKIIKDVSSNVHIRELPLKRLQGIKLKAILLLLKLRMTRLLDKLLEIRYQTGIFGLYKKRPEEQRP